MRQIASKLNIYVRNATIIHNSIEKFTLKAIVWSFGVLALLYLVFLGNMVGNIVERRSLEVDALALSSEVSNLELTYLSLSNNVDLAYSYSLGFKEAKTNFATRKSLGLKQGGEAGAVKTLQNDL